MRRPIAILIIFLASASVSEIVSKADEKAASNYEVAVRQYLAGDFASLEETLKAKDLLTLKGQERLDITYIRQSFAETRPSWWKQAKTNKRTPIHYMVFGRSVDGFFDPDAKSSLNVTMSATRLEMAVSWTAADMDSTVEAEHGYSKGDLNSLNVFSILGTAAAYPSIPQSFMANASDEKKALLNRTLNFQGNVAGVYYGSPRARQWALWFYMHSYLKEYAKLQDLNARKAIAVAFMTEVAATPENYPSVKLPDALDNEKTEEKLALAIHQSIENKPWTLAEDKAIRAVIKTLAADNPVPLTTNGKIKLREGLLIQLDPEVDEKMLADREAWFKKRFDARK